MEVDDDLAFALFLQKQFNSEDNDVPSQKPSNVPTSLVDPSWEFIDPNPDIRQLFLQFNQEYFDGLLGGVEVRWSPRMTLCAGLCCYEGRGGLCSVRLSEPLLKLRPRKDLVETLLHEMIHALLFVTQNNKDHDGHGPEFHKHMYRINKQTGTNISVYHNFHDEVNAYRQHWWKCNGPCQKWSPFYGVVKRAMNRAPAPRDTWWNDHKRKCGGEFTKVKEPENYGKRKAKGKSSDSTASKGKKEKGKVSNSDSKPDLPTFFDKLKKTQSTGKSNSLVTKEGSGNTNNSLTDSSDENLEHSPKKPRTDDSGPSGFNAFTGKGNVLGGSKPTQDEQKRVKHPLETLTSNDKANLPSTSKTSGNHKGLAIRKDHGLKTSKNDQERVKLHTTTNNKVNYPSTSKTTGSQKGVHLKKESHSNIKDSSKNKTPSLTIIDAFARCKDTQDDGSKNKPINLCNETLSSVICPSCQSSIPLDLINSHLDTCLAT